MPPIQAEELANFDGRPCIHLFISSVSKFLLPVGTVGLGTQELSWDLVHLRCLWGICGVRDGDIPGKQLGTQETERV